MIAERNRVLAFLQPDTDIVSLTSLVGVPAHEDTESIAAVGQGLFLLGTESMDATRDHDVLRLVSVSDHTNAAVQVRYFRIPFHAFPGLVGEENKGIEGLCAVGNSVFLGFENVVTSNDQRFAVIGRFELPPGTKSPPTPANVEPSVTPPALTGSRLALSSLEGKLSALSCSRPVGEGSEVSLWAIERHFATMRLVHFRLPRLGVLPEEVRPDRVISLEEVLEDQPNLEGLWVEGNKAWLLVDNHYRVQTGPTELIQILLDEPR